MREYEISNKTIVVAGLVIFLALVVAVIGFAAGPSLFADDSWEQKQLEWDAADEWKQKRQARSIADARAGREAERQELLRVGQEAWGRWQAKQGGR